MKPNAAAKKFAIILAFFGRLSQSIRSRAEKWAPIGYQDDKGFHLGDESLLH